MKFLPITLLTSILFISCNSDDDDTGSQYQEGWNDQVIKLTAEECNKGFSELSFNQRLCATREGAKLFTLEDLSDGLTEAQNQRLIRAIAANCN